MDEKISFQKFFLKTLIPSLEQKFPERKNGSRRLNIKNLFPEKFSQENFSIQFILHYLIFAVRVISIAFVDLHYTFFLLLKKNWSRTSGRCGLENPT